MMETPLHKIVGHVLIRDPHTHEVFVDQFNAITRTLKVCPASI